MSVEEGEEGREVCVGGLPPDTKEDDVLHDFSLAGEIVEVRVSRRDDGECTGTATVTFQNREGAEKACQIKAFGDQNIPIGAVISKSVEISEISPSASMTASLRLSEPMHSLTKIFTAIREQPDRKAFVAGSMKAYMDSVSGKCKEEEEVEVREDYNAEIREAAVLQPDMNNYLDKFPKCRMLMVKIRTMPNNDNKTPAGVLNEYATKLNLELQYEDSHNAVLGPFISTCKMSSMDGNFLYAEGVGRASKKKDAKQMSAAAALENLLEQVPESDFMQPGKNRFMRSGYHTRGRPLRPGLGSRMQQAGNRLQGPRPIAAGKRKFGEVFASSPAVNHSPAPPATGRGGGMVHGLGMIAIPNQTMVMTTGTGMDTPTGAMGMDAQVGMVSPTMMTPMGPMMPMGGMVMSNGNAMLQSAHPSGLMGHVPTLANNYGLDGIQGQNGGGKCMSMQWIGGVKLQEGYQPPPPPYETNPFLLGAGVVQHRGTMNGEVNLGNGMGVPSMQPMGGGMYGAPNQFWM
ncbi:hypothetical protein BSKO_01787 [Bryopsis sp. KO-2023]|nr:hypothetical protein BSKO_01787 [Bryopsis sp. KO-2023]